MKRIIVSVTNDLTTDQRIYKVCNTLHTKGYEILLIGRKLHNSEKIIRPYKTYRLKLLFNNGFLFYAEYNFRLFIKLFFTKKDILLANDLDTLLPNFLISKIFKKKLVYDSHELFTEVPELINRPFVQNFWLKIEKYIFPKLKNVYTVNQEIATIYSSKYNVPVFVIRNIAPELINKKVDVHFSKRIKGQSKLIILQGTGINIDRGAEEAVEMMQYLPNYKLYIIGSGDSFKVLYKKVALLNLTNTVFILNKMPYQELMEYTKIADLGLSLDKNTNLNYTLSLPNKIFDYIQAETPILASNTKLITQLIIDEKIGWIIDSHNPRVLAKTVEKILMNKSDYDEKFENIKIAAKKYNWETESVKLAEIYNSLK